MPELPEVEVSRLGISPHLEGQTIEKFIFRTTKLRWDIPQYELKNLEGQVITQISRRAKYLLIDTAIGTAIVHLGMSGSLRVLDAECSAAKHDHVDLKLTNGKVLRYNDPRRFGAWLWCQKGELHPVLESIGPEPLTREFDAGYISSKAQGKRIAVKQFIMDTKIVVGVGNIYANESLFRAKINPLRKTSMLTYTEWESLVEQIKSTLSTAIKKGGTTLNDFSQPDGKPGYFVQELLVYGKVGEPCPVCAQKIQEQKIGQRNSFFCTGCQV